MSQGAMPQPGTLVQPLVNGMQLLKEPRSQLDIAIGTHSLAIPGFFGTADEVWNQDGSI